MLPQASSSSSCLDSVKGTSSKSIAVSSSALSDADETEASVGIYEPVSGILRRKLRPSSDSWFTCHAFSNDGCFLATGEKNGTLRVWSTDSYECISKHSDAFNDSISAISFYKGKSDRLIAVDRIGSLKEFKVTNDEGSSSARQYSMTLFRERESVGHCTKMRECLEDFLHQFSRDGDIILSLWQEEVWRETNTGFSNMISVRKLEDEETQEKKIDVSFEESQCRLPLLSENGRSVLLWSIGRHVSRTESVCGKSSASHKFCIVPELNFDSNHQRRVHLPGERASWGEGGEYLLVWDTNNSKPRLSVYETHSMLHVFDGVGEPVFKKRLNAGLTDWKAKIMPPSDSSSGKRDVLIYEISGGRRIFSIWDMKDNVKTRELNMKLSPQMTRGLLSRSLTIRPREDNGAAFDDEVMAITGQDVFFDFCASNDGTWIAAVAWDYQTVAMSSMNSGVTVWTEIFEPDLLKKCQVIAKEIKFDPSGKHLLLIGDGAIQAIGPSFLDADLKPARHVTVIPQDLTSSDDISDRMKLLDVYRRLPSKMLAKTWEVGTISNRLRLGWFRNRRAEKSLSKGILDAALSLDNNLLALIVKGLADASYIYVRDSRQDEPDRHDRFMKLEFPLELKDRHQQFTPERIFLFENDNGAYNMALFATGERPVAVFCSFEEQKPQIAPLEMKECLMINRGPDPNRVILLGGDCVSVVNLQKRSIESFRPYQAHIGNLTQQIYRSMQWSRREQCTERRISDEGDAVLLGWDTKNQRSIVVTPAMRNSECRTLINESDNKLSECCALSASGEYTAFFDVNDLKDKKITIGIFSEKDKKIIFRIEVSQDKRLDISQSDTVVKLLSNVFYGFSEDETELIVSTIRTVDPLVAKEPLLLDELRRFNIRPTTRCVANRELLRLVDGRSDPKLVKQLCTLHECSLFNTPLPTNQTLFQEAFIRRDVLSVERIKEFVREEQYELTLEWEPTERGSTTEEPCDLLKKCIESKDTTDMENAVKAVTAGIIPYSSAAKIMKNSFKDLLLDHTDLLERVLRDGSLLQVACKLKVHVDFLNPTLRRDKAVHINTTDSFLDWSQCSDESGPEQMWHRDNSKKVKTMERNGNTATKETSLNFIRIADAAKTGLKRIISFLLLKKKPPCFGESNGNTATKETSLNFIRIADAAKTGMEGIIRPLLLKKVPPYFFEFEVVKCIVMYKWLKIWKQRFLCQAVAYVAFLVCFTVYACLLSTTAELSNASTGLKVWTSCLLGATVVFGLRLTLEEGRQMCTYMREGKEYFNSRLKGLRYFLGFRWNLLDLFSCSLLLIVVPLCHVLAMLDDGFNNALSLSVAIEAIVAFGKIWYFAQPFRRFGSLVRMVGDVAKDCVAFLALGLAILLGFAVALRVLFRHITAAETDDTEENDACENVHEKAKTAFGTLERSVLTLFYALVGDFDQDVYLAGDHSIPTVITFVVYLIVQMIVLLNFLISVMGDTFDRVQYDEEGVLLNGRAEFIDACEASLSQAEREKINNRVKKYVYVLKDQDTKESLETDVSKDWVGRIHKIEDTSRKLVENSEKNIKKLINKQTKDLEHKMSQLQSETKQTLSDLHGKLDAALARLPGGQE